MIDYFLDGKDFDYFGREMIPYHWGEYYLDTGTTGKHYFLRLGQHLGDGEVDPLLFILLPEADRCYDLLLNFTQYLLSSIYNGQLPNIVERLQKISAKFNYNCENPFAQTLFESTISDFLETRDTRVM